MAEASKKTTVYLAPRVCRALRMKATRTKRSVSSLINDAVRLQLIEDTEDIAAFEQRKDEPDMDFSAFVKSLKRRGRI